MYKLLLILRYLRRKLVPLFAALAVMLCTAMVIIVISVMGGFLEMMRTAAHKLTGDVSIRSDLVGFPDYTDMLAGLRQVPGVAAATPVIRSYGLLKLEGHVATVEVMGIEPSGVDQVTEYRDTLHWNPANIKKSFGETYEGEKGASSRVHELLDARENEYLADDLTAAGMSFKSPPAWRDDLPAIVPGIAVNPFAQRNTNGDYIASASSLKEKVTLTVLPLTLSGAASEDRPPVKQFRVVNEFKSGLYDIDANRVYVPLNVLQTMLKMDPAPELNMDTGERTGRMTSGRVSEIMIRGKPGVDLKVLASTVNDFVEQFAASHPHVPPLWVETWQQRHAVFLDAVEKEKGLLVVLFAIISVVAVAMIAVIFYMIVLEKTRDIGVLRALGASRQGIMSIFLGYGLGIGILGASLGLVLSAAIVWNLNEIQAVLYRVFGFKMWDPAIYYFDKIPSKLNPVEVTVIVIFAALSGVIGSGVPAFLAGRLNPVEALRYE